MIDLWAARFSDLHPRLAEFQATLADDERARAERFIDTAVRTRFELGRGFLRRVLADYMEIKPERLRFESAGRGKPVLPDSGMTFNLSHSDDLLLLGVVAGDSALGVDVERIRAMKEMPTIARSHFAEIEQEAFFRLPPDDQPLGFYTAWTRKEAFIKATGDGFKMPLKSFAVTLTPEDAPRLLFAEFEDAARWSLLHLTPAPGYVGAACIEGDTPPIRWRNHPLSE